MTISREKCLEWAVTATGYATYHGKLGDDELQEVINRAYADGQKDMRDRAAKHVSDTGDYYENNGAMTQVFVCDHMEDEIRALEIT